MATLSKEYRRQLENTVLKAREEAERGAAAALESYGVADAKLPGHLDEPGKELRRKLRAHGRQVGDVRRPDDSQEVEHLIHECAYVHWHRMLFARFLAENGFLIEPESGLDVDFAHCEEEAKRLGIDPWEVAAGYAQRMLLDVFRSDDPVLRVRLPVESRNALTALLTSLPQDVFLASDSLGWVYQFWQAKKKEEVNAAGNKIGADELPSVTQLFTEDYMVDFLLDNTLGAWWAGKLIQKAEGGQQKSEWDSCKTEEDCRRLAALPGVDWKYLRFVARNLQEAPELTETKTPSSVSCSKSWYPASGVFEGWPKRVKELRVLDPCMGSGHFVVAMFERLVALRMAEEKLDEAAAVEAVIRDNLFGLEIDPRCTQIGAFNLALAAWRRVGHCRLPAMNLACSGLAPNTREADWLAIAGDNEKLQRGMERLYRLFQKASVLGSLINPRAGEGDLLVAAFHELQPLLEKALAQETKDDTAHEMAVTARGLAKAAEILAGQFTLVATNVPYLGRNRQEQFLKDFSESVYPESKQDLATCFVERCIEFCSKDGVSTLVTPQSWLFQDRYADLRKRLLLTIEWQSVIQLGAHAFETISGERVNVSLLLLRRNIPNAGFEVTGLNVASSPNATEKAAAICNEPTESIAQRELLGNPDARIVLEDLGKATLLLNLANSWQGIKTSDDERFTEMFWEQSAMRSGWSFYQRVSDVTRPYSGRDEIIFWEDGYGRLIEVCQEGASFRGKSAWGKTGVAVSMMGDLPATLYTGEKFSADVSIVEPKDPKHITAAWAFCASKDYAIEVRKIDRALRVTNSAMAKVPFDLAHWQKVAAEKYPNGLPKPFSSDPTQWLFSGHPKGSDHPLQVAVARLVGYRWPRQTGSSFPDCPALGPDGLEKHADNDGVVCFSQARDEAPAAERLRSLLADAYGKEWGHSLERKLIADTGSKAESLEEWLVNDFFAQHCDLFHNRPFVWHIWDGRKDGFNVLVNYHKLAQGAEGGVQKTGDGGLRTEEGHAGRRTLETLAYAYLGDWIGRQRDAVKRDEAGAEDRLAAALELQGELKNIIAGEPPYDLFIRWKGLAAQAIGWNADINDGVRLNCRPFVVATLTRGKKGAGLFRGKFNVKWEKDRGKEPKRPKEDFPWFWKWDEQMVDFPGNGEFDGNRWNDCHYTTAFKRAARERKAKQ